MENGTWVRDPFPGNVIPKNLFDPAVVNFLAKSPFTAANDPGIPGATGPTEQPGDEPDQEDPPHPLGREDRPPVQLESPQFLPLFARVSPRMEGRSSGAVQLARARSERAERARGSSQLRVLRHADPVADTEQRVTRRIQPACALRDRFHCGSGLGEAAWNSRTSQARRSLTSTSATDSRGLPSFQQVGEDFTFQNNITKITGKHTIKAGYELLRTRYNATAGALPSGTYNFGGTNAPFTPNTGIGFANFLLGTVTSATYTQEFASWLPRWWSHQFYIQDDWKPFRGLTLNLGLRYSYETPFQTKYGQQAQFDPTVKDPDQRNDGRHHSSEGRSRQRRLQQLRAARRDGVELPPELGIPRIFRIDSPGHLRDDAEHPVPGVPGDRERTGAGGRSSSCVPSV